MGPEVVFIAEAFPVPALLPLQQEGGAFFRATGDGPLIPLVLRHRLQLGHIHAGGVGTLDRRVQQGKPLGIHQFHFHRRIHGIHVGDENDPGI